VNKSPDGPAKGGPVVPLFQERSGLVELALGITSAGKQRLSRAISMPEKVASFSHGSKPARVFFDPWLNYARDSTIPIRTHDETGPQSPEVFCPVPCPPETADHLALL
jgi:hypothetical protein